ncbi:hypothetical protein MSI_03720 [Treponema sp. JC4]|uniref:class I SAM-dependent methyltransferase n=1 Tax=Treponema sp. JC4 TaxID=1124982 RepID=UPI00025B0BC7|nr:SAM-dependent methyltransferase [Treponema sp. JC4]EID85943.1 hypothetical protein MSI_03720 [Treponema sp. JC4]
MLISATLSKPAKNIEETLGKPYNKIKITAQSGAEGTTYFCEFFTEKQVFHKHLSEAEAEEFIDQHAGKTFKSCVKRTEAQEITILANKKGKITTLTKNTAIKMAPAKSAENSGSAKKKNYLLPEGVPVPFLELLGIMNAQGKVIAAKYDKFRQINRFLEFVDDVLDEVMAQKKDSSPVRIADFGCGKSYLTFAVHYFLTQVRHIPCDIEGLDLKKDVIDYCNQITKKLGLENLIFHTGNISDYSGKNAPDIVITLHACDTATDFALEYACQRGAKAILSVPCCQHQINTQLQNLSADKKADLKESDFAPLLKYGLVRERFSALLTDALRGQWLEAQGYSVQLMEFIDIEHTPKNILIRAVKKSDKRESNIPGIITTLGVAPEIWEDVK